MAGTKKSSAGRNKNSPIVNGNQLEVPPVNTMVVVAVKATKTPATEASQKEQISEAPNPSPLRKAHPATEACVYVDKAKAPIHSKRTKTIAIKLPSNVVRPKSSKTTKSIIAVETSVSRKGKEVVKHGNEGE